MILIKHISEQVDDEIEAAEEYASCALSHKEDHPELAKIYYTLAAEELNHVTALHGQVVKLIEEYKAKSGEPPVAMKAVYDWLHEREMDNVAEIKTKLAMFK